MSIWQIIKSVITMTPVPLTQEWEDLDESKLTFDKFAPVNLVGLKFDPEKEVIRQYISAERLTIKLQEIYDCLVFFRSNEATDAPGFSHFNDDDFSAHFELTISIVSENQERKPGVYMKFTATANESLEYAIRYAVQPVLEELAKSGKINLDLKYKLGVAHEKWQKPERFEKLTF